jgi:hypothetical protein
MQVESELSGRQMRCPVVLPFVTKQAKVLFDFLVLTLYFAVTLWMVGSSKAGLDTEALIEGSHETGSELRAPIGEDLLRDFMEAEYVGVVDVSGTLGCKVRLAGHEMALIRVVVDVNTDGIESGRSWKLGDKVDTDMFPGRSWCFVGLERRVRMLCGLVALALVASEDVLLH